MIVDGVMTGPSPGTIEPAASTFPSELRRLVLRQVRRRQLSWANRAYPGVLA
jgi:hypothetical protein